MYYFLLILQGPTVRTKDLENQSEIELLAEYMSKYITATRPELQQELAELQHPSSHIDMNENIDMFNLVNQLQQHSCRDDYCRSNGESRFS